MNNALTSPTHSELTSLIRDLIADIDDECRAEGMDEPCARVMVEARAMEAPPRLDPRYVQSDDPQARLRAWAYGTMDMGGWTDSDRDAFLAAILDEHQHGAGEPVAPWDVVIEAV